MTNLIIVTVALVAGLAIGGGVVLMWINQRKIPLDPYTDRYKIDDDDLVGNDKNPIGILDHEFANPLHICEITMEDFDQNERVQTAQWVADALNRHRG